MPNVLHTKTTRLVWIKGLYNNVTEAYVNDATGDLDVYDADGVAVELDISFVNTTNGDYYAIFPETDALTDAAPYTLKITLTSADTNIVRYIEALAAGRLDNGETT